MSDEHEYEPEQFRRLFVSGLSFRSTNSDLRSHFERWGPVEECFIVREPHTSVSRGFGFVTYRNSHMVDDAQAARPHQIDGCRLTTKRAAPREDSGKPEAEVTVNRLFVRGLNDDVDEQDLINYFGTYGNVVSVNLVTDRGFAFVEFDDYDPVDKIVWRQHQIKGRTIEVQKALSRREMERIKRNRDGRGGRSDWQSDDWRSDDGRGRGSYGGSSGYSGYRR